MFTIIVFLINQLVAAMFNDRQTNTIVYSPVISHESEDGQIHLNIVAIFCSLRNLLTQRGANVNVWVVILFLHFGKKDVM